MQAILLISYKGYEYIDKFCEQFNNDNRFNIYIQYDKQVNLSKHDILLLYAKHNNIKTIISSDYNLKDLSLIESEINLLKIALKDDNTYFHLMFEHNYIVTSLDNFYNTFDNYEFITINNVEHKSNKTCLKFIGSKYWSLSRNAILWLFNIIETTKYDEIYKDEYVSNDIFLAAKTYFHNIFKLFDNDFLITNDKRFIEHNPNIINLSKYIQNNIIGNVIIENINIKDYNCTQLLKQMKYINRYVS